MDQSFDLTPEEAVQVLLARHAFSRRVKAAFGMEDIGKMMPSSDTVSQFAQNVITPPAGEAGGGYRALQGGLAGAGIGALGGAGLSMFGKNRKNWARNAMTGALLGGGLGAAVPGVPALTGEALKPPESEAAALKLQNTGLARANSFGASGTYDKSLATPEVLETGADLPKQDINPKRDWSLSTLGAQALDSEKAVQAATDHANNNMPMHAVADVAPVGLRAGAQGYLGARVGGAIGGAADARVQDRAHIAAHTPVPPMPATPTPEQIRAHARATTVQRRAGAVSNRLNSNPPTWRRNTAGTAGAIIGATTPLWEPYAVDAWNQLIGSK